MLGQLIAAQSTSLVNLSRSLQPQHARGAVAIDTHFVGTTTNNAPLKTKHQHGNTTHSNSANLVSPLIPSLIIREHSMALDPSIPFYRTAELLHLADE